ncbi:hypothetical protein M8C13_26920 [Crossiella sp. SN42]|uniref:hypothetical protein n=1 Tax=Crossiella sp. SN42 TaxID=2944808 RepID=UPI00207C7494|nr:hypothetical protein [Crossiella sp. SN42]MCO1579388.1 hypothetical protein [Crossiella sp. SN42]
MNNNLPVLRTRFLRVVMALLVALGALAVAPVAAASAADSGSTVVEQGKKKVKVNAKANKKKVKKGEEVKIDGSLEELAGARSAALLGSVILQSQTSTGLWVNLGDWSRCRPNGTFSLSLLVQTSLTLRVQADGPDIDVSTAVSSAISIRVG